MGILDDCTAAQIEAITHVDGPLLVVAGAGSGKTRVITRRIAYLEEQGVQPRHIIGITFTNKAAGEMRERVEKLAGARGVWVSTFHSMCARMLRQMPDAINYGRDFTIYDAGESLRCIKECMKSLEISTENWPPDSVQSAISNAKNALVDPDRYEEAATSIFQGTVARIYRRYHEMLERNQALDFDDLLFKVAKLMTADTPFREYWRNRFRYVLIDEYQDTNHAQYLIARELAAVTRSICATGDPDQSIYGWRGADISNILEFVEEYPDAKVVKLEENFRSTKFILKAASTLIQHNTERIDRELFTAKQGGSTVKLIACPDEEAEAEAVASRIRGLAAKGCRYGDISIFYRTNFQSRVFEQVFRLVGIPYTIVGTVAFYNRKEIKDALSYLRLLANDRDDLAALRVINVPPRGIGTQTVATLQRWAQEQQVSLMQAVRRCREIAELPERALKAVESFQEVIDELATTSGPVAKLVKAAVEDTGYLLWTQQSKDEARKDREDNLGELISAAAKYDERTPGGTLQSYLEEVALVSTIDEFEDSDNRVVLMTVHAAKGLEFPVAFVTGMEEGLFPHEISMESASGVEEERRLCYVAITRAQAELYLTYARARMRFGLMLPAQPSRFIAELPDEAVETLPLFAPMEKAPDTRPAAVRKAAAIAPAPEPEHEHGEEFHVGEKVRHPTFGLGEIREITGSGSKQTVLVRFKNIGVKRLVMEYAKLEKV